MRILKQGVTLTFICPACDCEFVVGIHSVSTTDQQENFYGSCPQCGAECHTDWAQQKHRMTAEKGEPT